MPGRRAACGTVGDPHRAQSQFERVFHFSCRHLRIVQRQQCHADQPVVAGTELGHAPVVCPGCPVAHVEIGPGIERHADAERGEDELSGKPEQVQGRGAFCRVEGAQCLVALGPRDQVVSQSRQLRDGLGRVGASSRCELHVVGETPAIGEVNVGDAIPDAGVRMYPQKVRQLHEVAVGIEVGPIARIGHGRRLVTGCAQ